MAATLTLYDSFLLKAFQGTVIPGVDTFYAMLTNSAYTANKGTHVFRSDVTNEAAGTGYTAGGKPIALTVTANTTAHTITVEFAETTWANATLTARSLVVYKRRGGAPTADELVACFTSDIDVTSTSDNWTLPASSFVIQN